jgi:hypothetical protein
MNAEPVTCNICGALITEKRGGDLVRQPGHKELVWVHPACYYVPRGDARFAFLSLDDPVRPDAQGWVQLRNVEVQRGCFRGSDDADFETGLAELVDHGWVESKDDGSAFRISAKGSVLRRRLGLE